MDRKVKKIIFYLFYGSLTKPMAIHLKQCIFRLGPYLKIIYEHNQQIGGQYTKENVQACDFLGNKFFLLHFISLKVKV